MSERPTSPHPPPARLILLYTPRVEGSAALADEICRHLAQRPSLTAHKMALEAAEAGLDADGGAILVVLGGDGSMLRAGALAAPPALPILGVNLGRLGFLGEVQPEAWQAALDQVLAGRYWLEERLMLHVEHHRAGQLLGSYEALNEAVVGRGALARPVRLKALLDGGELTTYVADGLIVATPTGSTAYALAAGGPILPPELKNLLLIPIAPHLSIDRAIVLPRGTTVEIIVHTDHQAILSADGHYEVPLQDGDRVLAQMSAFVTRFVRVRPRNYFYMSLMQRMQQNPSAEKKR